MEKQLILSKVSISQIYAKYLGLDLIPEKNINSPFSDDKTASLRVYKNGTFKCFSTGKQGDIWQFVAYLNNLDCKTEFNLITVLIAEKMGLANSNQKQHFSIKHIPLTPLHYQFWQALAIDISVLEKYNVKAVSSFEYYNESKNEIKKFPIFSGVLAFSYEVNGRFEVYIPKQEAKKVSKFFMSKHHNEDVFGLLQLENFQNNLFITAGKKDCLVLNSRGFNSVSFKTEAIIPAENIIQQLKAKCKNLFICYDNDFGNTANPGRTQMLKISDKYNLIPIHLPEKINDIADYFKTFHTQDFQKLANESYNNHKTKAEQNIVEQPKETIFHTTERYLLAYYDFRFNTIKLDIEIKPKSKKDWVSLNENSLYIEMQKKGINISIEKLLSILKSDFVPHFNPLHQYFNDLPLWKHGDKDYISELANFVKASHQDQFNYHLKKWLVRSVKCAQIADYFNKQAFVLVHSSQNSGKSTWCRFLCPPALSEYIAEDISNDKDARILLCKNFLINLDELAVLSRQEINSLKSYFSKTQINERLPYDRKNSIINRTCSFIGSTNMDEFLSDDTGSVRWLCFIIKSISWEYKKVVDINRVWSQALALANDINFESELSIDDINANEIRNKDFEILTPEKALIVKHIEKPTINNPGEFCTATDIEIHLRHWSNLTRLNSVGVGRAMRTLGYEKSKCGGISGYYVIKKTVPLSGSMYQEVVNY
ncbi:MAG: hypothetical protein EAZ64_08895 [Sphingobacteriales bacterium]|nr:MAG: hypothetical protein EAZ64_08895 [Sphingobacteriales bacterium]